MNCAFCDIVHGRTAAHVVYEDGVSMAFLDARPLFAGHVLLAPREHIETFAELPPPLVAPLFEAAQRLSRAVETAMNAEGTFVAMNNRVSQSVPHLHIHIVPRRKKDGLKGFFWPRGRYAGAEEMEAVRARLEAAVHGLALR